MEQTGKRKKACEKPWLRRGILMALLLAICVLVYGMNGKAPREEAEQAAPTSVPQAAQAPEQTEREIREKAYQQDMEALNALLESENIDDGTRQQAQARLLQLIDEHQTELGIEEALVQAGYGVCMALCQNGALTVMVDREELSAADSAAILSLCVSHSDISVENIRIMNR